MSDSQKHISSTLGEINKLAPGGYALGVHIEYNAPRFMFQTYAKSWLDHYSSKGLIIADPMVPWGFQNTGSCRWSDLDDPHGVFKQAADFGMPYGLVIAEEADGKRSICGFANADREFTDDEISQLEKNVKQLHSAIAEQAELSTQTVEHLKKMSIMVTHPGS